MDSLEEEAVVAVMRSKRLFRYYGPEAGPSQVAAFEQAFAAKLDVEHALGVNSGTSALTSALVGLGVGPGDEVIVPGYTWVATALACLAIGAVPVIAEVDEGLGLDTADVASKVSERTRAVIVVHMTGVPARIDALVDLADRRGLVVLEDVAQALGASFAGRCLGTWGRAGAFSLQFNKVLTTGEGGMVITDDGRVYERAAAYHDVAARRRDGRPMPPVVPGVNNRMAELQGAIGVVQLARLDGLLATMRAHKARILADLVAVAGLQLRSVPDPEGDASTSVTFFVEEAALARRMARALRAENVSARTLYAPDVADYHVYPAWEQVLQKRTLGGSGWPYTGSTVEYEVDMCPRTLDLLSRAVHFDVNPLHTERDVAEIGLAVAKVAAAYL